MKRLGKILVAAGALAAPSASACYLELGITGMTTSDPLSIPVLVAARKAADDPRIVRLDGDEQQLSDAVATLGYLPMMLDGETVDGPPVRFAVLQAQSGYWSRFVVADGTVSAEAHVGEAGDVDAVIVVADGALLATVLHGRPADSLRTAGVLRARGGAPEIAVSTYVELLDRFVESDFGRRLAANPSPRLGTTAPDPLPSSASAAGRPG